MKRILPLVLALAFLAPSAMAQWTSAGPFPADDPFFDSMHGVAVDAEGKVWLTPFSATDSIQTEDGTYAAVRAIYVYNPDGTPADFSPIRTLTVGGVTDTLLFSSRGLTRDQNGDIIYSYWDVADTGDPAIFRIDHQTGEATDKALMTPPHDNRGLAAAAVDENGNVFVSGVFPGDPISIYDVDFNFIENAVDSSVGFSRAFMVSEDGNTIYWSGYSNLAIFKYTREDEFSGFDVVPDTLFRGVTAESFARDPSTGNIWFSAGPSGSGSASGGFTDHSWYEIDVSTDTIVDSLKWDVTAGILDEKPRGIGISPDGNTAYAVMFDATSGAPSVQKFEFGVVESIEKVPGDLPASFTLKQNYPNPFNPSTNIEFTLNESAEAKLQVFDVLGREVAVLVDGQLTAGTYSYQFDASNLPSGTYVYQLTAGGERRSASMILAK